VAILTAVTAVVSAGPMSGRAGLGPEVSLDGDLLFGGDPVPRRAFDDLTPLVIEAPRDRHLVERMRSGHLDLWNPLQGTGVPLPPDQGGFFGPLRLCHLLFPGQGGYVFFHVVRLWIAAVGVFFLARARRTSRPGALLAGVVFGLGGGMIAQLPFVSAGPVCFFPWVVLAQTQLLRRPSPARRVLLGLAVAATLTAGHPTLSACVLLGAMAPGLVGIAGAGRGKRLSRARDLAVGWAFGAAFAAPFLFSFVEYVQNGYSYKNTAVGLREHATWIALTRNSLAPAIAAPATLDALRDTAYPRAFPYLLHFVAGTAAWVLAGVGLLRRRVPAALLVLFSLGVILSFQPGVSWSGVPLVRHILARYYWPLVILPVACAAGAGADVLSRPKGWHWLPPALGLFALDVVAAFALPQIGTSYTFIDVLDGTLDDLSSVPLRYHLAVAGALVLTLLVSRFLRRRRAVAASALFAVVAAELVLLVRPHLRDPRSEALRRPLPAAAQRLAEAATAAHARMTADGVETVRASLPLLAGIPDLRVTAPLVPARYEAFLEATGLRGFGTHFLLLQPRTAWADLAAVRFIVTGDPEERGLGSDPAVRSIDTLPHGAVLEIGSGLGRAHLFFGATVAASRDEAATQLGALAYAGELGERVVLEPAGEIAPAPLAGSGRADVRWILDDADEVVLETDGESGGYLMLADTYYPGWRATVDGGSSPIFPADVGFRAVAVPPGKHTVRFVYRPLAMGAGVVVMLAAVAAAWMTVRRRGSGAPRSRAVFRG
jgi:hypothetical protein